MTWSTVLTFIFMVEIVNTIPYVGLKFNSWLHSQLKLSITFATVTPAPEYLIPTQKWLKFHNVSLSYDEETVCVRQVFLIFLDIYIYRFIEQWMTTWNSNQQSEETSGVSVGVNRSNVIRVKIVVVVVMTMIPQRPRLFVWLLLSIFVCFWLEKSILEVPDG